MTGTRGWFSVFLVNAYRGLGYKVMGILAIWSLSVLHIDRLSALVCFLGLHPKVIRKACLVLLYFFVLSYLHYQASTRSQLITLHHEYSFNPSIHQRSC